MQQQWAYISFVVVRRPPSFLSIHHSPTIATPLPASLLRFFAMLIPKVWYLLTRYQISPGYIKSNKFNTYRKEELNFAKMSAHHGDRRAEIYRARLSGPKVNIHVQVKDRVYGGVGLARPVTHRITHRTPINNHNTKPHTVINSQLPSAFAFATPTRECAP